MLPKLAESLDRQKASAYGFVENAANPQYPVFEQCRVGGDIDRTPVNNIEQERQCGDIDNRLKKKSSLNAYSRGAILKETLDLLDHADTDFRNIRNSTVKDIKILKTEWKTIQMELISDCLTAKEEQKLCVETRKLSILEQLRADGVLLCLLRRFMPILAMKQLTVPSQSQTNEK